MRDAAWAARFGRKVREARLYAELTQQELADRVGCGRANIANIELGRQNCPLHVALAIASELVVPIEELVP